MFELAIDSPEAFEKCLPNYEGRHSVFWGNDSLYYLLIHYLVCLCIKHNTDIEPNSVIFHATQEINCLEVQQHLLDNITSSNVISIYLSASSASLNMKLPWPLSEMVGCFLQGNEIYQCSNNTLIRLIANIPWWNTILRISTHSDLTLVVTYNVLLTTLMSNKQSWILGHN